MVSLHEGAAYCRVLLKVSKTDHGTTQAVSHQVVSAQAGV